MAQIYRNESSNRIKRNFSGNKVIRGDDECCCCCDCLFELLGCPETGACSGSLEVELSGIGNQSCDCSTANDTFIIDDFVGDQFPCEIRSPSIGSPVSNPVPITCSGVPGEGRLVVNLFKCSPLGPKIFVFLALAGQINWLLTGEAALDGLDALCNGLDVDVPFSFDSATNCAGAGSTCTIRIL